MNKLWQKIVIGLVCALIMITMVTLTKVTYAASDMPEFGQILTASLDGLKQYFKFLIDVLTLIW